MESNHSRLLAMLSAAQIMVMLAWRPCQSTNTEFPKLVGRALSPVSYWLGSGLVDQVNGDSFRVLSIFLWTDSCSPDTATCPVPKVRYSCCRTWLAYSRLNRPCNYGCWIGSSGTRAPCAGANLLYEHQLLRRRLSSSTVCRSCPAASGSDGEVDLCFYRDLGLLQTPSLQETI